MNKKILYIHFQLERSNKKAKKFFMVFCAMLKLPFWLLYSSFSFINFKYQLLEVMKASFVDTQTQQGNRK